MDTRTVNRLENAIVQVFCQWERLPSPTSDFRIVGVLDSTQCRYTLLQIEWRGVRHLAHTLAYLEIRDSKIWIEVDNTETGVGNDLVALGIGKGEIVLGFYTPAMRALGEFARS